MINDSTVNATLLPAGQGYGGLWLSWRKKCQESVWVTCELRFSVSVRRVYVARPVAPWITFNRCTSSVAVTFLFEYFSTSDIFYFIVPILFQGELRKPNKKYGFPKTIHQKSFPIPQFLQDIFKKTKTNKSVPSLSNLIVSGWVVVVTDHWSGRFKNFQWK